MSDILGIVMNSMWESGNHKYKHNILCGNTFHSSASVTAKVTVWIFKLQPIREQKKSGRNIWFLFPSSHYVITSGQII